MTSPSVAVVVPVYNRPVAVLEALNSVAAQSFRPTQLIVVDDGSSDDTADRVNQWIVLTNPPFPVQLIRARHQGAAAARNRGAAEVGRCDMLAFLDSDDLWPADYLQRMCAALASDTECVAACCNRMELDARTNCLSQLRDFKRWQDRVTSLIFRHGSPSTSLVVMRAAIFHTVGGFDETLPNAQDYNLFLRMSLHGHWMFVPGLQVIRRNYLDELYGGAPQITQHATPQVGNLLVQAKMLERFIHEQGGRAVIPGYIWRRKLSRVWYSVGCLLRTRGQTIEARDCYLRAIRACPWHVKAWRNYLGYSPTR